MTPPAPPPGSSTEISPRSGSPSSTTTTRDLSVITAVPTPFNWPIAPRGEDSPARLSGVGERTVNIRGASVWKAVLAKRIMSPQRLHHLAAGTSDQGVIERPVGPVIELIRSRYRQTQGRARSSRAERPAHNRLVGGSNPPGPTIFVLAYASGRANRGVSPEPSPAGIGHSCPERVPHPGRGLPRDVVLRRPLARGRLDA